MPSTIGLIALFFVPGKNLISFVLNPFQSAEPSQTSPEASGGEWWSVHLGPTLIC